MWLMWVYQRCGKPSLFFRKKQNLTSPRWNINHVGKEGKCRLHVTVNTKFLGRKLLLGTTITYCSSFYALGMKGIISWHRWNFICPSSWANFTFGHYRRPLKVVGWVGFGRCTLLCTVLPVGSLLKTQCSRIYHWCFQSIEQSRSAWSHVLTIFHFYCCVYFLFWDGVLKNHGESVLRGMVTFSMIRSFSFPQLSCLGEGAMQWAESTTNSLLLVTLETEAAQTLYSFWLLRGRQELMPRLHRITEWFGLQGTVKDHLVQLSCSE